MRTGEPNKTHALEVIEGDLVAEKVEEDVLESASVSVGEDEAITVGPLRVGGVGLKELGCERSGEGGSAVRSHDRKEVAFELTEKDVGGRGHSHGSSSCDTDEFKSARKAFGSTEA